MSQDIVDFLEWCQHKGFKYDGLELRSAGEGCGNGIFATKYLRREWKCIALPEEMMLTAGRIADMEPYADILDKLSFRLNPFEVLTLFFCLEDEKTSAWSPYLRILPKTFDTPAYLEIEIDPVHLPLSVRDFYQTQLNDLKEIYPKLQQIIPDLPYKKFLWAWHVVNTRCIYVDNKPHPKIDNTDGDTLAVIPFVDMLNHSPQAQGIAMHDRYSHEYVVKASLSVLEDDQFFVCYGPHDNARLWIEYGFTMPDNPNLKVVISTELFIALAGKSGVKVSEAHETALNEAGLPSSLYKSDEGPSWALRTNAKILLMDANQVKHWQDVVYVENDETSTSSDESSSSTRSPEDVLLHNIIQQLLISIQARVEKVPSNLQWIWQEQVDLVQKVLQTLA